LRIILEIDYIILAIHLIVGFALVYFAAKAFHKTKYPPMLLLVIGFSLLVIGDTVIDDLLSFTVNSEILEWMEESIEIAGFLVLIFAVKRS
jgi:hypothetical protein